MEEKKELTWEDIPTDEESLRKELLEAYAEIDSLNATIAELNFDYSEQEEIIMELEDMLGYLLEFNESNKELLKKYSNTTNYIH